MSWLLLLIVLVVFGSIIWDKLNDMDSLIIFVLFYIIEDSSIFILLKLNSKLGLENLEPTLYDLPIFLRYIELEVYARYPNTELAFYKMTLG